MIWRLESFELALVYRSNVESVTVLDRALFTLSNNGQRFAPTMAYKVVGDSSVEEISVEMTNPGQIVQLATDEAAPYGFDVVTLYNEAMEIDWWPSRYPMKQPAVLRLCLKREHVQSGQDVQTFLAVACDLRSVLLPCIGHIVDVKVEASKRVSFEHHRNLYELPETIRWANFLGPEVVERLGGVNSVKAAPAHEVRVFADGGVLLLSTPSLLTYGESRDVAQRQAIWEWLQLDQLHAELSRAKEQERLKKRRALGKL